MTLVKLLVIHIESINANVHELHFGSSRKIIILQLLFQIDDTDTPFYYLEKTGLFYLSCMWKSC